MSKPAAQSASYTPTITLQEHFDKMGAERDLRYTQLRAADAIAISAALLASEKAVTKADIATEKRFDGVNEFRQALTDLSAKQVSRDEYQAGITNLTEKINSLAETQNRGAGRSSGTTATWAIVVTLFGVGFGVIGTVFAFAAFLSK